MNGDILGCELPRQNLEKTWAGQISGFCAGSVCTGGSDLEHCRGLEKRDLRFSLPKSQAQANLCVVEMLNQTVAHLEPHSDVAIEPMI